MKIQYHYLVGFILFIVLFVMLRIVENSIFDQSNDRDAVIASQQFREILIVDPEGQPQIKLHAADGFPQVLLKGEKGEDRINLHVKNEFARVLVHGADEYNDYHAAIIVKADGSRKITLDNRLSGDEAKGKSPSLEIVARSDDWPETSLMMFDNVGNVPLLIGAKALGWEESNQAYIFLHGAGDAMGALTLNQFDMPDLSFYDNTRKKQYSVYLDENGSLIQSNRGLAGNKDTRESLLYPR